MLHNKQHIIVLTRKYSGNISLSLSPSTSLCLCLWHLLCLILCMKHKIASVIDYDYVLVCVFELCAIKAVNGITLCCT